MLILKENNLAFVHIPKCGGTSVTVQVRKYDKEHWDWIEGTHTPPKLILSNGHEIENWFFQVRNPYARFVSAYHHLQRWLTTWTWPVEQILLHLVEDADVNLWPMEKGFRILFRPQVYWYVDNMPFFKLEEKTIWTFLQENGFPDIQEKTSNYNPLEKEEQIVLTDKQKEIVYNFYKQDFETFGYDQ